MMDKSSYRKKCPRDNGEEMATETKGKGLQLSQGGLISLYLKSVKIMALLHIKAIHPMWKILWQVLYRWSVTFQMHLLSVWFLN